MGLMLSQKARYALRALLAMAEAGPGRTLLVNDIAREHRIPKPFLDQILLDLKHHGIVQSKRGRSGGYSLLKPASEITFGMIVRLMDGSLAPLPCLSRMAYRRCDDCESEEACRVRKVFALVHNETVRILDGTSLTDAIDGRLDLIGNGQRRAANR